MNADRLCCWKSGEEGVVTGVHGDGALCDRLQELGVIAGAWVRVVQHGSPMLIQIGNSRICLRRDDARKVGAEVMSYNG